MDLAIGIILLSLGALILLANIILTIGGAFSKDNQMGIPIGIAVCLVLSIIGLAYTIPSAQSCDYVETYIMSFHPESNDFVIGMAQGKYYYVLDANDSSLIERSISSSKLVRDEETNPYIQKVSKYGEIAVTYYIHIPMNTIIFVM